MSDGAGGAPTAEDLLAAAASAAARPDLQERTAQRQEADLRRLRTEVRSAVEGFYGRLERRYARTLQRGVFPSRATARAAWAAICAVSCPLAVAARAAPLGTFQPSSTKPTLFFSRAFPLNNFLACAAGSPAPQAKKFSLSVHL